MMANFSKQYCDKYHPGFSWDFDIEREVQGFKEGEYVLEICEGFGSVAYGKINGKVALGFVDLERSGSLHWVYLEDVTSQTHTELFIH